MAVALQGIILVAGEMKEDFERYKVESACAMKQVQYGVERKDVDFSKCKEITWEPKI